MGEFHTGLPPNIPLHLPTALNSSALNGWANGLYDMFNPRNYMYERREDVPDYTNKATPLFQIAIVSEIFIQILLGRDVTGVFYSFTNVTAGLMTQLSKVLVKPMYLYVFVWVYDNYRLVDLQWDSLVNWWIAFLTVDFFYYWLHRIAHEVNFVWASHQAHHSSEDYNLGTALRQGIVQHHVASFTYLPAALFIPPPAIILHHHFSLIYQFFIHTEIINNMGPLEYVLNTPSHHRVHHGRNPYCIDTNYGGTLIIWDRLFGTFAKEDEPVAYGLVHVQESSNIYWVQFGHYIDLWKRMMRLDGISNKLGVWLRGPGWLSDQEKAKLTPEQMELPAVENPIQQRDFKKHETIDLAYVAIHFLMMLNNIYAGLTLSEGSFGLLEKFAAAAYLQVSFLLLGMIMDKKSYCFKLELIRCIATLVLDYHYSLGHLPILGKHFQDLQPYRVLFVASTMLMSVMVAGKRDLSVDAGKVGRDKKIN